MIIEEEYVDYSFTEDFSAYYVKCFQYHRRNCSRVHFFLAGVSALEKLKTANFAGSEDDEIKKLKESYLGFIVVRPLPFHFIGKTCLKIYENINVISIPCKASLFGVDFLVESLPFQEQDKILSVCATSSLWTFFFAQNCARNSFWKSPYQITQNAIKEYRLSESNQLSGLTVEMICNCIEKERLDPIRLQITDSKIYTRLMHTYLESKLPVIVVLAVYSGIPTKDKSNFLGYHAVTAVGDKIHSFDLNSVNETPVFSGDFISEFYVHDDRVGPFARLDRSDAYWKMSIDKNVSEKELGDEYYEPTDIIIGLYNKIRLPYEEVRNFAFYFYNYLLKSVSSFEQKFEDIVTILKNLVIDIRLETTNSLKSRLRAENVYGNGDKEKLLEMSFPKYCWIIDFTFEDNKKLIEFVIDSTENKFGSYLLYVIKYNVISEKLLENLNKYLNSILDNAITAGESFELLINQHLFAFYNYYHKSKTTDEVLAGLYGVLHIPSAIHSNEIRGDAILNQNARRLSNKSDVLDFELCKKTDYYLWVVDKEGCLLIGIERKNDDSEFKGHPTLLQGRRGRIGGELRFDENKDAWKINAFSGRYSKGVYSEAETKRYLRNVKKNLFEQFFPNEKFLLD